MNIYHVKSLIMRDNNWNVITLFWQNYALTTSEYKELRNEDKGVFQYDTLKKLPHFLIKSKYTPYPDFCQKWPHPNRGKDYKTFHTLHLLRDYFLLIERIVLFFDLFWCCGGQAWYMYMQLKPQTDICLNKETRSSYIWYIITS